MKTGFAGLTQESQRQKISMTLAAVGKLLVEEFGVKLHTEKGTFIVLHCLNRDRFHWKQSLETRWELLDLVTVGMPNRDLRWEVLEDTYPSGLRP